MRGSITSRKAFSTKMTARYIIMHRCNSSFLFICLRYLDYNPNLRLFILVGLQLPLENFNYPNCLSQSWGEPRSLPRTVVTLCQELIQVLVYRKALDFVTKLLSYLIRYNKFQFIILDFLGINNSILNITQKFLI